MKDLRAFVLCFLFGFSVYLVLIGFILFLLSLIRVDVLVVGIVLGFLWNFIPFYHYKKFYKRMSGGGQNASLFKNYPFSGPRNLGYTVANRIFYI